MGVKKLEKAEEKKFHDMLIFGRDEAQIFPLQK